MKKIKISKLKPHPHNIRKEYDKEYIKDLGKSIQKYGILNPILALKDGTIVAGHCRWMACKLIGKKDLKVNKEIIILKTNPKDTDTINAVENIMRRNLNVFEESDGLYNLIKKYCGIKDYNEAFRQMQNAYIYMHSSHQKLNDVQKKIIDIADSMGITHNMAMRLIAFQNLTAEARRYIISKNILDKGTRMQFSVDKIYQLSFIPKKDQMRVARAFVHARFSDIKTAYKQWKNGLRGNDFTLTKFKLRTAAMVAVNAAIERRDRMIASIKETSPHFTLGAFIMDMKMLQDSIKIAESCADKEDPETLGRMNRIIDETVRMLTRLKNRQTTHPSEAI